MRAPHILIVGALGGACAALAVVALVPSNGGNGAFGFPDGSELAALEARVEGRLAALETRAGADDTRRARETAAVAEALHGLIEDLELLRKALRFELLGVDSQLADLRQMATLQDESTQPVDPNAALSDEDEPRWVIQCHDPDPGVRFSALVRLGRRRTGRSVRASRELVADEDPMVRWQALKNLGAFGEREQAPLVAESLADAEAIVRFAAYEALIRLGAPADTGFDPVGDPNERDVAAQALTDWTNSPE